MYQHWDANVMVVLATALAVCAVVLVHYEGLNQLSLWLVRRSEGQRRRKVLYGIFGVLALHVAEIWIFGFTVWGLLHRAGTGSVAGVHTLGLLDAVYLSAATYTTLGFGDLAPVGPIRFTAGTMALTGFVLVTWSASFTYLEMSRDWRER
jgi:hypothetical protein